MFHFLCDLSARLGREMKLKDEQNQAIEHLLCGRDVLVVFRLVSAKAQDFSSK